MSVSVNYETFDGTAGERPDYTTALGTLRFAAGETQKSFDVLLTDDGYQEGEESINLALSNPTGGAVLGSPFTAVVALADNDATPSASNPVDDAQFFVRQHYHDFLNRPPDPAGLRFWTQVIEACGADAQCREVMHVNVSAAFFLSIEFQQTGFLVMRFYKATYADTPQHPRGLPRYREFLRDTQELQRGVVVGQGDWEQRLVQNRQEFLRRWVAGPDFLASFPAGMTPAQFVDKLFAGLEVTPTQAERDAALAAFGSGDTAGRAEALLSAVNSGSAYNRQFNPGFVLMQYFGYLRRNPDDAPDNSLAGYDFWLDKLNQFSRPGEDVRDEAVAIARVRRAEMARAFVVSQEYRARFR